MIKKIIYSTRWWITNVFICNFPIRFVRNKFYRIIGIHFAGDAMIYEGLHVRNPKGIIVEDGVSIGPKVLLDGRCGLKIKKNAVIAYEAIIWTLNHDYNDIHFGGRAPVEIGEYAWICSRSIILPGIKIGKGAVVASGAVVTKNVPDYAVVGGVPARIISWRDKKDYDYGFKE